MLKTNLNVTFCDLYDRTDSAALYGALNITVFGIHSQPTNDKAKGSVNNTISFAPALSYISGHSSYISKIFTLNPVIVLRVLQEHLVIIRQYVDIRLDLNLRIIEFIIKYKKTV